MHALTNKNIPNKVIVWGVDDFNTLGLMRELGQFDLDLLFLIKGKAGFASKSIYCKQYLETRSIKEGFHLLLEKYANLTPKPILIVSGDGFITYIDEHKTELETHFILPGCKISGNIKRYIDKNNMTKLANEMGILCPKSYYAQKDTNINEFDMHYPCLIKPAHQKPGHYNEFKFKICNDKSALRNTLRFVRQDSEFIVQEYVPKEKDLLIYGGRMADGNTILAGAMIRDRFADSGSASHGIMTNKIPQSIDINTISAFLERIDYYGLFSFEYGMKGDKAYFFEVNLRNDGTSHYFFQAGANIPLAYVYSCVGLDYSHISTTVQHDCWFIDEVFDIENVIKGTISKHQWKQDLNEATIFKYYDKKDPKPWELVNKHKWKQIIQDLLLKKFRIYIVFVLDKLGLRK